MLIGAWIVLSGIARVLPGAGMSGVLVCMAETGSQMRENDIKKRIYLMAILFMMIFCSSGRVDAVNFMPEEMLVVSEFTVDISGVGCGSNSGSAWGTVRGGSRNTATARIRNSSHIGKSPAIGRTPLPTLPVSRLRSSTQSPLPQTRWKRMRSKALIQGRRMFLVNSLGKKQRAPTGTYKLNNGKFIAVRNGQVLPKSGCP